MNTYVLEGKLPGSGGFFVVSASTDIKYIALQLQKHKSKYPKMIFQTMEFDEQGEMVISL